MIVLKGRVLDGNGGAPIEKGAVVLEDNRIRVGLPSQLPDDPQPRCMSWRTAPSCRASSMLTSTWAGAAPRRWTGSA